jgi:hypothetical protein
MKMAGKILVLMALLIMTSSLKAQKEYRFYDYRLMGLRAGFSWATIDLQPAQSDVVGDFSYSGGMVFVFSQKKYVGVQIEALFTSRKWKETFDTYQAQTELSFVEIPLLTNINLGTGKMKYIINLGTYFAMRFDKKLTTNMPSSYEAYEALTSREERNSDFGLLIGGALRYFSSVGVFQLDARFAYGYQKMYSEDATGFRFSNMPTANVGIIYMINLKKDVQ